MDRSGFDERFKGILLSIISWPSITSIDRVHNYLYRRRQYTNMTTEDEIRTKLTRGIPVEQLINMDGYKKSTVYKVRKTLLTDKVPAPQNAFFIENIKFNGMPSELYRGKPSGRVTITGNVRNMGLTDFYVSQVGVMPEWLEKENMWYSNDETYLLRPNQTKNFIFSVEIGGNDYGEYALKFGVTGQWLSRNPPIAGQFGPSANIVQTMWADPVIMQLKKPRSNYSVFISHSVTDMTIVRHIANFLDLYGIEPIIAEDVPQPGSHLSRKFNELIDRSSIFLVLLTDNGVRSEWVKKECVYAFQTNKIVVPVKEQSVIIKGTWFPSDVEWIEFSVMDAPNILVQRISEGIGNALSKAKQIGNPSFVGGLLIGSLIGALLAVIFGGQ